MKYEKNEREYPNNFSSNESAEKVWNSIREKEFQEAIIQMKTMKMVMVTIQENHIYLWKACKSTGEALYSSTL